jgi:tetratricopeptide (TPR) repeat protein
VLLLRAVLSTRLARALLLTLVVLGILVPFAPRSIRRLPVIHRVYAAAERVSAPWQPALPAYVPQPVAADTWLETLLPEGSPTQPVSQADRLNQRLAAGSTVGEPSAVAPATPLPPLPETVKLEGMRHQWQTWNNCGPATITMATSFFGRKETQTQAAAFLKPNPEDKNVRPDELVAYVGTLGLQAQARVGGDLERLKHLLAHQIPVVVEVWIAPEPNDWMGHYRLLVGYDDRAGRFIAYDSIKAPGIDLLQPYAQFDEDWRVFNRTYIAVYGPDKAAVVDRILGQDRDDRAMYERALAVAQREVVTHPENAFAWFNLGSSLVALDRHAEAAAAYDKARTLKLPWRMLWYQFGPFEAYLAQGRLNDVLALAAANLQRTNDLEESHYYRGRALQAQGQIAQARSSYQAAIKLNPKYLPAHHALSTLS